MAYNHFIIGLGGVGGRSIAEFRRTTNLRKADYDCLINAHNARFEYLYIDSNTDILGAEQNWMIAGVKFNLAPGDVINLRNASFNQNIKQLSDLPNIKPWVGNIGVNIAKKRGIKPEDMHGNFPGMEGAGQLRRYGRVLFAQSAVTVRDTVNKKIQGLVHGNDNTVHFHVFATLGGGTGSGSIIDMVMLLNDLCGEMNVRAYINLYVYVASTAQNASDVGSFFENEYATLRDLNALMVETYRPFVVTRKQGSNLNPLFSKQTAFPPIRNLYLSSELAPGNAQLPEQIRYVTSACFDAMVYRVHCRNTDCLRALSGEDLVDNVSCEKDAAGNDARSYRFAALAARRWCVPTLQIKELLRHELKVSVLDMLLDGTPMPGNMSRDTTRLDGVDFRYENCSAWEEFKAIEQSILGELDSREKSLIDGNKRDADVLINISRLCEVLEKRAKSIINDGNVQGSLQPKYDADAKVFTDIVAKAIDNAVTWTAYGPVWGLKDADTYINALIGSIGADIKTAADAVSQGTDNSEIIANMKAREEEWKKLGPLTIHFTSLDEHMIQWHVADSKERIRRALSSLRGVVLREIGNAVSKALSLLRTGRIQPLIKQIETERDNAKSRIGKFDQELLQYTTDAQAGDMYEYDEANLEEIRKAVKAAKQDIQMEIFNYYRPVWLDEVGSIAEYQPAKITTFMQKTEDAFRESTKRLHDKVVLQHGYTDVMVSSIYQRLYQLAGPDPNRWDDALGRKVENFLRREGLGCSTTVSGNDGLTEPQVSPVAAIVYGYPQDENGVPVDFIIWLKSKMTKSKAADLRILQGREDDYTHMSTDEIRVLYMPHWMPARFAPVVQKIYERYNGTLQKENGEVTAYFANIDDGGLALDSPSRPPLTKQGDPDLTSVLRTDIADKDLYFSFAGNRMPLINHRSGMLAFVVGTDDGIVDYTKESYPESMIKFPGEAYTAALDQAIKLARESMTLEERRAIYGKANQVCIDLQAAGLGSSDEFTEARKRRDEIKRMLHL